MCAKGISVSECIGVWGGMYVGGISVWGGIIVCVGGISVCGVLVWAMCVCVRCTAD